jgi:hypothetical protein
LDRQESSFTRGRKKYFRRRAHGCVELQQQKIWQGKMKRAADGNRQRLAFSRR